MCDIFRFSELFVSLSELDQFFSFWRDRKGCWFVVWEIGTQAGTMPWGWGENSTQQPKIYSFPPPEKSTSQNLHLPLSKVSFPSSSNFNLSLNNQDRNNHPIQVSTVAVAITVVSFFSMSSYMHTYVMLVLINPYLLNVVFSMTKTLNVQNSPKQNFNATPLPTFQCY